MRIVVTGGAGFLGWHLRARLRALTDHEVVSVDVDDWDRLSQALHGADAVMHLAGINRASDADLLEGNRRLAEELVSAADAAAARPRIIYANSIQAANDSPYGRGKAAASATLLDATQHWESPFVDILLPNLFGEHGRPGYNSFVATFVAKVIAGETPQIDDRPIALLHAQSAAQAFIDALEGEPGVRCPDGTPTTVQRVWSRLEHFHDVYSAGRFPALASDLDVELFNTYRAALFPARYPLPLTVNADQRGWLVETACWLGGEGQTFVSTTKPGITRGEHYHLRKIERFVVLAGQARISLRKVCTDDVVDFDVSGDRPVAIDMPTGWIHNITNTGSTGVVTQFWVNEIFNPDDPDTFWEPVRPEEVRG